MISWWCDRSVRLVSQPVSCDGERARDQSHMWPRSSCGHLWNLVSDSPELSLCMSKRQESHLNWTDANVTSLLGDNWSSSNGTGGDKKYSKPGSQDFIVAQPINSGMQEMHLSCLLRRLISSISCLSSNPGCRRQLDNLCNFSVPWFSHL